MEKFCFQLCYCFYTCAESRTLIGQKFVVTSHNMFLNVRGKYICHWFFFGWVLTVRQIILIAL